MIVRSSTSPTTGRIILDEVQRAPGLLHAVKRAIDAHREQRGEGRCGRWDELLASSDDAWPDVLAAVPDLPEDSRALARRGGYPTPALELPDDPGRAICFEAYASAYLERDLQALPAITALPAFRRTMRAARAPSGTTSAHHRAIAIWRSGHRDAGDGRPSAQSIEVCRTARYHAITMNAPVRDRSEALGRLAGLAPQLQARGVASLRVFGSAGRDAMTDESDIDILIEFDRPIGAFEVLDLQDDLEQVLGRPVDLVTPAAVKERMRPRIEREAIDAIWDRCRGAHHRHVGRDRRHRDGDPWSRRDHVPHRPHGPGCSLVEPDRAR